MSTEETVAVLFTIYVVGAFITFVILDNMTTGCEYGCSYCRYPHSHSRNLFTPGQLWSGILAWPLLIPIAFGLWVRTYPTVIKKLAFHHRDTFDE